ncbi:MAG: hypothetical protein WCO45_14695 [Pseudanabaena sp. ELA607]|jgi:hypothetical protein
MKYQFAAKRQFLAIATAAAFTTPILVPPANAETHRINRNYVGSLCVTVPVQNRSNIRIQWGNWNASVNIADAQASSRRSPSGSVSAGVPGAAGMLLAYVTTSYSAYQLLVDSTQPAYLQFEARGKNVENIDITGVPHSIRTGKCGINGVSVNSIIRL